jgi:hypothetical protein
LAPPTAAIRRVEYGEALAGEELGRGVEDLLARCFRPRLLRLSVTAVAAHGTLSHRRWILRWTTDGEAARPDSQSDQRTPRWVERELTHSRNVIANAKVVVTFSAALAATFASAALDSKKDSGWDEWAAALMFLTLAVSVVVILLRAEHHHGELDDDPARELASCAYWLMLAQIGLSVATIIAAVVAKRQGS